jgi:hypothetical protein
MECEEFQRAQWRIRQHMHQAHIPYSGDRCIGGVV